MKKILISLFIIVLLFLAFFFGYFLNNKEYLSPETVATLFFKNLSEANYNEALKYYGGSFETLKNWNPDIYASDNFELIKRGCEQNGLNCLSLRSIIVDPTISTEDIDNEGIYDRIIPYLVTFEKKDGGLFESGPCCGEEDSETKWTEFIVFIAEKNGKYLVLTLPPYTP